MSTVIPGAHNAPGNTYSCLKIQSLATKTKLAVYRSILMLGKERHGVGPVLDLLKRSEKFNDDVYPCSDHLLYIGFLICT